MQPKQLRVFVLFSGGASLAKWLIANDPAYGIQYIFVGSLTDKSQASGRDFFVSKGIPSLCFSYQIFCKENDVTTTAPDTKERYFSAIGAFIKSTRADIILCAGFMRIIPTSFIARFPLRILNVHPADLRKKDLLTHARIYTGANAVEKAYLAGEQYMYSTIHHVAPPVDGGEIITVSPPYTTDFSISWQQNQEKMKDVCDGPAGAEALHLLYTKQHPLGISEAWNYIAKHRSHAPS